MSDEHGGNDDREPAPPPPLQGTELDDFVRSAREKTQHAEAVKSARLRELRLARDAQSPLPPNGPGAIAKCVTCSATVTVTIADGEYSVGGGESFQSKCKKLRAEAGVPEDCSNMSAAIARACKRARTRRPATVDQ